MAFLLVFCWFFLITFGIVYLFFKYKFLYWKKRGVVFVKPSFPNGNIEKTDHLMGAASRFYYPNKEHKILGIYATFCPILLVTDLDIVQNILVKDFDSFADRPIFYNERDEPLLANLLTLPGDKWRPHRSKLSPTFTAAKLKFMYPTLVEIAKSFRENILRFVENDSELRTKEICSRFTLDVVGSCIFGIDLNTLHQPDSAFYYYGSQFIDKPQLGLMKLLLATAFPSVAQMLRLTHLPKESRDFFRKSILDIIENRARNQVHRKDFVELVLQMGKETVQDVSKDKKQIDDEVAAESFMFFIAGFETSSSAITLACYELAKNPNIQEKLRQEIKEVLDSNNGELTYESLQSMTYLDKVISETLRKYPAAIISPRRATRNCKLEGTNVEIEKGTLVVIPVFEIHRDPDIYPQPDVFDPERFSNDEIQRRHPMAFLGFSAGPRNCIGMRFGRIMTRIGLIMLLQTFRFRPAASTQKELEFDLQRVTLFPVGDVPLRVEKI